MTRASEARRQRRQSSDAWWAWVRQRVAQGSMREVPADEMLTLMASRRGLVIHTIYFHDAWCAIYDGAACNCRPDVRYFTDTNA